MPTLPTSRGTGRLLAVVLQGSSVLAACSGRPLTVEGTMADTGPHDCPAQVSVLATNLGIVTGIAGDGQYVYVGTNRGPVRIPVRGGSPEKVSAGSPETTVVAVDSTYVYWNDWTGVNQGNGFPAGGRHSPGRKSRSLRAERYPASCPNRRASRGATSRTSEWAEFSRLTETAGCHESSHPGSSAIRIW